MYPTSNKATQNQTTNHSRLSSIRTRRTSCLRHACGCSWLVLFLFPPPYPYLYPYPYPYPYIQFNFLFILPLTKGLLFTWNWNFLGQSQRHKSLSELLIDEGDCSMVSSARWAECLPLHDWYQDKGPERMNLRKMHFALCGCIAKKTLPLQSYIFSVVIEFFKFSSLA